jgi:hypothetical protein
MEKEEEKKDKTLIVLYFVLVLNDLLFLYLLNKDEFGDGIMYVYFSPYHLHVCKFSEFFKASKLIFIGFSPYFPVEDRLSLLIF